MLSRKLRNVINNLQNKNSFNIKSERRKMLIRDPRATNYNWILIRTSPWMQRHNVERNFLIMFDNFMNDFAPFIVASPRFSVLMMLVDKLFIDRIGELKIVTTYMKKFWKAASSHLYRLITISVHACFGMRFPLRKKNLIKMWCDGNCSL